MFWLYLNYTLGALGYCMQQPHTFLCCYYYFEFNIRKPRLLPGQDAVGSKLLPGLCDLGMDIPAYTEVNKWCCWESAKSYVQHLLSPKRPRLISYPSHPSMLFVWKGSFWTRNVKWGKLPTTTLPSLIRPLILVAYLVILSVGLRRIVSFFRFILGQILVSE